MSEIERLQQLAGIVTERDAGDSENVKLAVGHVDNERDMVRRNLYQMGTYCVELYKMLGELPDSDSHIGGSQKLSKQVHISVMLNTT